MNLSESIKALGLPKVLKSLYPNLVGVNFDDVSFHLSFDQTGFENLSGNSQWAFAIGQLPILYIIGNAAEISEKLDPLLLVNGIDKSTSFVSPSLKGITFWQADGFKIELVNSKPEENILIVTQDVSSEPVDSSIFKKTEFASELSSVNWISGINPLFSEKSIPDNKKSLKHFDLCPLHFHEDSDEYILIPLKVFEYAKPIIEYIIRCNGGFEMFTAQQVDGWENAHTGRLFAIGFLPEVSCIRINRIIANSSEERIDKLTGIHPKSDLINSIVRGLESPIYAEGEGVISDGRLIGMGPEASNVVGFDSEVIHFIKIFKKIVLQFNPDEQFLNLSSNSITMWLDENPEETITFDVENTFTLILSKGESLYRINILPSDLSFGWNENPELSLESDPKVVFSRAIELASIPVGEVNAIDKSSSVQSEVNLKKDKQTFIQNSLDDQLQEKSDKKRHSYMRWIWGCLALILLLLLLKNCEFNPDSKYYYERGLNKYDSGKIEKAEKDFGRAINLDNSYSDAYEARGELYLESERFQEARYDFDQLIRIDENNWYAYYLRGLTHMKLANSQYSDYNRKAINDFTKSIELNSTSVNGRSYYQRASVFKSLGDERSCEDFYTACDFEIFDACEIVDNECRPKSGSLPYENIFGPGVYTGEDEAVFVYNNKCTRDAVVTIKSTRTRRAIRSVYVRSGDEITMTNIPVGFYTVEILHGLKWTTRKYNRGAFSEEEKAIIVNKIWRYTSRQDFGGLDDCVFGGDLSSDDITLDEYFNK